VVSSVWTSTLSSRDPATESPEEEEPPPDLVIRIDENIIIFPRFGKTREYKREREKMI